MADKIIPFRKADLTANQQKWGTTLMQAGFTIIPNVIIERQKALGLDGIDLAILAHLAAHWWFVDRRPFLSKRTLADALGVNPSTIRRHIAEMEQGGLIKRIERFSKERGRESNEYDFSGLIERAKPFAEEVIAEREDKQQKRADRAKRKRARKTAE